MTQGLWATAFGGDAAVQRAVLLEGGVRGEGAVQQMMPLRAVALGGWVAKGWMMQLRAAAFGGR